MKNSHTQIILSNGLKVFLKEIHTAPIISSWLWYRVGSRDEVQGHTGISHWVEHMQFKGTPQFPQCGFSALAVQVLNACGVKDFASVNVLADQDIRQGIKQFANWPTIPQLYVNGEFVGGSDIMREMYQSGELQKLLEGLRQQA